MHCCYCCCCCCYCWHVKSCAWGGSQSWGGYEWRWWCQAPSRRRWLTNGDGVGVGDEGGDDGDASGCCCDMLRTLLLGFCDSFLLLFIHLVVFLLVLVKFFPHCHLFLSSWFSFFFFLSRGKEWSQRGREIESMWGIELNWIEYINRWYIEWASV